MSKQKNNSAENKDQHVVDGFGEEWSRFSQAELHKDELKKIFEDYFGLFPWHDLPNNSTGADIGCGSGRWAKVVLPRVGFLTCVDASNKALLVAKQNLSQFKNVTFQEADVGLLPFQDESLDFAYSLGVLHHVPDTLSALKEIYRALKKDGIFLVYLYYAFDNRPFWFRMIWKLSDLIRKVICRLPSYVRFKVCDVIAAIIYWPIARLSGLLHKMDFPIANFPLAYYSDKSFYVMRTDALDRFGTCLEKRFTKQQINELLRNAGFVDIMYSDKKPYWCALARKQ